MSKYTVLVIISDTFGCGKYRSLDPHEMLARKYPELFTCHIGDHQVAHAVFNNAPEFLKQYDLVHIHKQIDPNAHFIQMCKFLGKKVVLDLDDHYILDKTHPMYAASVNDEWAKIATKHMHYADAVTTTTHFFKNILKKHNPNVEVFPNAIDPTEEQFKIVENKSDRLRVGIICGSSHLYDIEMLRGLSNCFTQEELDKLQFVLCGFDTRGTKHIVMPDGTMKTEPMQPLESVWVKYENILTNDYSIVSEDYKNFLTKYDENSTYDASDEPFARYWTKPVDKYATHYNNIDILLAPIIETEFNLVKSQLKVIEAGFFKKPIIASNFGPYTIDIKSIIGKNGTLQDGNGILIENRKGVKEWAKAIKLFLEKPELVKQVGENLYESVKDEYSLEKVTDKRKDFYLKLLEN